jgi:hypothetical protein
MSIVLPYVWSGEAFEPLPGFRKRADAAFVVGQVYHMEPIEERTARTHKHYFACVNEAWQSMPDDFAERFPTPEALRKFALIKAGFADSRQLVAASRAEALRLAAFVRPMDEYALVKMATDAPVVTVWTAQSQSMRAMGKERFKASKDAVLAAIEDLLDLQPGTLGKQREAA